ncbi:CDGSH iron-sulfur domain-containing protein [Rasiella sp. SM2506]|uniref:CDGSH iron-sulfur domain-containing protein n=1 Tax=Rasiella sp. SM2506 TaxID=3423914 RepID=UPI003D79D574
MTAINLIGKGPLIVLGEHTVTLEDGSQVVKETRASYCRCGSSENFPFCDGRHKGL